MATVMGATAAVRAIRGEMRINPGQPLAVMIRPPAAEVALFTASASLVEALARARVTVDPAAARPAQSALAVVGDTEIYVDLAGVVDLTAERARLQKEIGRADEAIGFLEGKLARPDFVERAPAAVVAKERERLEEQRRLRARLAGSLAWLADEGR
jgi:valyl-tRNA synthetase